MSQCQISRLPRLPGSLLVLNLHQNQLPELSALSPVLPLRLLYLTLFGNPLLQRHEGRVRHYLVNALPSLLIYDLHLVVQEERGGCCSWPGAFSRFAYVGHPIVHYDQIKAEETFMDCLTLELDTIRKLARNCNPGYRILRWLRSLPRRPPTPAASLLSPKTKAKLAVQKYFDALKQIVA